ncbi:ankyrin-3-like [Chenopodium quinoa]|uniref:ankyrin-3-like n=1 Tax=Chenopodium quinoa TaxID=63459 RepID=UPI000B7855F6|nr:ankyrin-3-like [Chenopodium quinoa]
MILDRELKEAASRGDVKFLGKYVSAKPTHFILASDHNGDNIFHLATRGIMSTPFIREAIQILSTRELHNLLSQQENYRKWNPLHLAAIWGNFELLHLMLSVYKKPSSSSSSGLHHVVVQYPPGGKPWLARGKDGRTPLHMFLEFNEEKCGLEILLMDLNLLCSIVDNYGNSPLFLAISYGFNNVALNILRSDCCYSLSGRHGFNPFHVASKCSEEVWRLLYKKHPELLLLVGEDGTSVLHEWAKEGKLRLLLLLQQVDTSSLEKLSLLRNADGDIPLLVAVKHDNEEFALCLVDKCRASDATLWRYENRCEFTALDLALDKGWENLVLHFISKDSWTYKEPIGRWQRRLLIAAEKQMGEVVNKICNAALELIGDENFSQFSTSTENYDGRTVFYIVSHCTEEIWRLLYRKHPDIVHVTGENGTSMLHEWAKRGELWPILLLEEVDMDSFHQLSCLANDDGDIPLHIAIEHDNEEFALSLLEKCTIRDSPQWRYENKDGIIPLDLALYQNLENLVLHIISRDSWICNVRSNRGESRLFIATEKGMDRVVQKICDYVAADSTQLNTVPTENHDGRTIMYVLSNCTEVTAKLLLKTFPQLMYKPDQNGKRPIDIASEFGAGWLTKLLIIKDPSSIAISPNVWIELCRRGHLEAIEAFVMHYDDFRQLCIEQEDSPLHNIRLTTYQEYEKFLAIPLLWEMKNRRDYDGKTPLHKALEREDILFAELLLHKGVNRSIRDRRHKTATKLLAELCDQYYEWEEMAQRVGINPRLRNLGSSAGEMRTTLSVVAALLATLTFAAAFTVPGGFDQSTGEIILVRKVSFSVFILADTYAMCCAMFVLFCLIWSMVCDQDESQLLIDRSVLVLIQSFYGTLVAFMTGVYTVVHHKSLWAAILICVMCSLVGISTNRSILFRVLDKLDRKDEARSKNKAGFPLKLTYYLIILSLF